MHAACIHGAIFEACLSVALFSEGEKGRSSAGIDTVFVAEEPGIGIQSAPPHPTHGLDRPWPRDAKRYETIHFWVDSSDDLVSTSPWTIPKRGSICFLKQICQVNALFMNGQEYIYMH